MPLPQPASRSEQQSRNIACTAYLRDDGLWDIEGRVLDVNQFHYTSALGREVPAGVPLHEIWLRWTLDEDMVIRDVVAAMDAVPYPPLCPNAMPAYERLIGMTIGRGFLKEARTRIVRTDGCTHLFTLIEDMANMSMRAVGAQKLTGVLKNPLIGNAEAHAPPPPLLNSCHSYAAASPVANVLWPAHYTGPEEG